jgi:hypothetical protein
MTQKTVELGRTKGVPEVRVHHLHTEHRHTEHIASVIINADIGDDAWEAVQKCAIGAGAGAVLASIFATGVAAYPAFWAAFSACAFAAGVDLSMDSIRLEVKTEHGEWHDWWPGQ